MQHPMRRRDFLKRSAAAAGGLVAALSMPLAAVAQPQQRPYYILDPEHGAAGDLCPVDPTALHAASRQCHGCQACHSHGANKLFATPEAADQHRAHLHCKCLVRQGGLLPHGTWTALFGPVHQPRTVSADRRHQRTQGILQRIS